MLALYKGPHTDYLHYINITIMDSNKDRETATNDYYSSEEDGEATVSKKNEDYYSSEENREAITKIKDYYSDSSDTEEDKERAEKETYDDVFKYFTKGTHPQDATKGVLLRKAKSFQVVEGVLHYKVKK